MEMLITFTMHVLCIMKKQLHPDSWPRELLVAYILPTYKIKVDDLQ